MTDIKLGFHNLLRKDLGETAAWANQVGFQTFELAAGPGAIVNVDKVLSGGAGDVKTPCTDNSIEITSLAYCTNHLAPEGRDKNNDHMRKVIEAASQLEVGLVACFVGGAGGQLFNEMGLFEEFFVPLLDHAKDNGVKLAIENCPAGGFNIGRSPYFWREIFSAVDDSPNLGLEFDPSHLVWLQIDWKKALDEFTGKVLTLHAKDTIINADVLADRGLYEPGWWQYKLPGLGLIDWAALFAILKEHDFTGAINIEHEDSAYMAGEEKIKEGLLLGLKTLQDAMAASQ
ncbi:MAG TPA: sugar phosphate isomerase/epimerase family protein [Candidatus Lokiarchaeia archaeon]|nr:sugar phosphate isomerase/epimerase family protein [Candidatus Lokiarchaeia archaeon]